jgi:hypothetical protein
MLPRISAVVSLSSSPGQLEDQLYTPFLISQPPVDEAQPSSRNLLIRYDRDPGFVPRPKPLPESLPMFWDRPKDANKTRIHGGTFISGNVNNIQLQHQGESGECEFPWYKH